MRKQKKQRIPAPPKTQNRKRESTTASLYEVVKIGRAYQVESGKGLELLWP
jgi:hypothetical protein